MKVQMIRRCNLAVASALLCGGLFHTSLAQGALLNFSNTPLFIGSSAGVPPNVFFMLDDSGSMDGEFVTADYWQSDFYDIDPVNNSVAAILLPLLRPATGSGTKGMTDSNENRWAGPAYDNATSYGNLLTSREFVYYYNNLNDNLAGTATCGNIWTGAIEACGGATGPIGGTYTLYRPIYGTKPATGAYPAANTSTPILWDWRLFSTSVNGLYYNPGETYQPWEGVTTTVPPGCTGCPTPQHPMRATRMPVAIRSRVRTVITNSQSKFKGFLLCGSER